MQAQDHGQPALGYVLAYGALSAALDGALADHEQICAIYKAEVTGIQPGIEAATVTFTHRNDEQYLSARLAVLADGGRSLGETPGLKRETRDYGHDALVTKVQGELAHDNIAYERFTPAGPLALLPNGARDFSLVWTGKKEEITSLLKLSDDEFLVRLHRHFGDRVGRFMQVGKRMSFPLQLSYLNPVIAPHLAVIGNAAQTMHPVAGQGFNVGLRDAWELAGAIAATTPAAWGTDAMLEDYQKMRKADTQGGIVFTDFLVNVFSNDMAGLSAIRGAGLGLLDIVRPAKTQLIKKMSFGAQG